MTPTIVTLPPSEAPAVYSKYLRLGLDLQDVTVDLSTRSVVLVFAEQVTERVIVYDEYGKEVA